MDGLSESLRLFACLVGKNSFKLARGGKTAAWKFAQDAKTFPDASTNLPGEARYISYRQINGPEI
jgi:hypothetical protein